MHVVCLAKLWKDLICYREFHSELGCHAMQYYYYSNVCTEFHRLTFSSRISPEFHRRQKKNELHLCNSLIFNVAGAGIEPATS